MLNTVYSRGFYLPWAYQHPNWPDTPSRWGEVANDTSGAMQQSVAPALVPFGEAMGQHDTYMVAGFAAAPPFNEAMVPNSYNDSILPPSGWMNAIDAPLMVQQVQTGHLQVIQPEQEVVNTPAVIHGTVGTPAILAASERRRTRPRKYACHICGNRYTTKANRDCHVRAHYGIKPFVCPCGTAFTAKADLTRHRKAAAARFLSASDISLLCVVGVRSQDD